jgi:dTDP-4-dehydrorhamnose 3,5-epimerase
MNSNARRQTAFAAQDGWIEGAVRDRQSITADWMPQQELLSGVQVKEVRNVTGEGKALTEIFRRDWELDAGHVDQVFQVVLEPGRVSAWHTHQWTTDRLFVSRGLIKVALYDARKSSDTCGRINEFRCGVARPALIIVPPGVWHGVQNLAAEPACLINLVDRAYQYEDPDHWRLPWDTPMIPYSFTRQQ